MENQRTRVDGKNVIASVTTSLTRGKTRGQAPRDDRSRGDGIGGVVIKAKV